MGTTDKGSGAVGIARDITEQKQAEKEFAMSRLDKLSTLYVNNGDLAAILDEILELAIDFTGADMGNIQLLDAETGLLRMMAHRVRIPAYPDGNSGSIRTLNRKHPDTLH